MPPLIGLATSFEQKKGNLIVFFLEEVRVSQKKVKAIFRSNACSLSPLYYVPADGHAIDLSLSVCLSSEGFVNRLCRSVLVLSYQLHAIVTIF